MSLLIALLAVYIVGLRVTWGILDSEGPKTSNVSAGILMWAFMGIGRITGTIFWPFVLALKTFDFFYRLLSL